MRLLSNLSGPQTVSSIVCSKGTRVWDRGGAGTFQRSSDPPFGVPSFFESDLMWICAARVDVLVDALTSCQRLSLGNHFNKVKLGIRARLDPRYAVPRAWAMGDRRAFHSPLFELYSRISMLQDGGLMNGTYVMFYRKQQQLNSPYSCLGGRSTHMLRYRTLILIAADLGIDSKFW